MAFIEDYCLTIKKNLDNTEIKNKKIKIQVNYFFKLQTTIPVGNSFYLMIAPQELSLILYNTLVYICMKIPLYAQENILYMCKCAYICISK